jgi:hypothetical protein
MLAFFLSFFDIFYFSYKIKQSKKDLFMSDDKRFFISLFKMILFFFGFAVFTASVLTCYRYAQHVPKEIDQYTYTNNTLSFTLAPATVLFITMPKSSVQYELTLPKGTTFGPEDKISIVFLTGKKAPPKDLKTDVMYMKYGVKPIELNPQKEINFFVNGTLKYDLKDNLVLKQIYKDPTTGEITESVFE